MQVELLRPQRASAGSLGRMRPSALLVLALLAGCATQPASLSATPSPTPSATSACRPPDHLDECGLSEEELRAVNLRYADRLPFSGDPRAALDVKTRVERALAPIAPNDPGVDGIRQALTAALPGAEIATSDNAVRTAGPAFAVSVDGGCVFGQVYLRKVTVEIGGYVNDGGCLAVYGH